jgi:peroxiredoxin
MRFVVFIFLMGAQSLFAAKITGHFASAPAGDRFTLRVNKFYVDGTAQNYEMNTGQDGQFSAEIFVPEPQYVTLQHNSETLVLFVEPTDELIIVGDVATFPLQVDFVGTGAANNKSLQAYLAANPTNFNEFTKTRFKIANFWATIDPDVDLQMRQHNPSSFSMYQEEKMKKQLRFIDEWDAKYSGVLSSAYKQFMSTEIMYQSGFEFVVYANVYKNWHRIDDSWLSAALQLPLDIEVIGSDCYRRFVMAFMADRCKRAGKDGRALEYQFIDGGQTLSNKTRAFFQSEIICNGLKDEQYDEVLPHYSSFLKENTLDAFEQKITDLYEKKVAFAPGVQAPPFVGLDADGMRIADQDLRGKLVYLNFWASYCGSCIKKMEYINSRYSELHDAGIKVVNVSLDTNRDTWLSTKDRYHVLGFNFINEGHETSNFVRDYKVNAVPAYFIIDKYGSFVQKPLSHKPEDIVKHLLEKSKNQ